MTASPQEPHIGLIVEGPGDANSLPVLLRSFLQSRGDYRNVLGKPVVCNGRDKAIVPLGIERYVSVAAARPGCKAVLVVLDSEGDPICQRGPGLLERAQKVTALPLVVCLADRCWEDWLHASIETLQLGDGLQYSADSRGTGVIVNALRPVKYVKPTWQPRLTARMNIDIAVERSLSLNRLFDRFVGLLSKIPT